MKRNIDTNKYKLGENERLIFEGVNIPIDVGNFDIKADVFSEKTMGSRSRVYQQQTDGQKYKTKLVQLFRELERLTTQAVQGGQGPTDADI